MVCLVQRPRITLMAPWVLAAAVARKTTAPPPGKIASTLQQVGESIRLVFYLSLLKG